MKRPRLRAFLGLGLIAAALVFLALSGDLLEHAARTVVVYAVAVAGFCLLATAASSLRLRTVVVAALLLRLAFLPVTPSLSDDVYRYLWDGRVQLSGFNPYLHAPDAPALDGVDYPDRDRVNHPHLRTPYPPLSQLLFLAVAAVDGGVALLKVVAGAFDLLTAAAVWWLAAAARRRQALVLYLLCPAVIVQVWGSAHVETPAVALTLLSAVLITRGRDAWAGVLLALAVAAKATPLVLLVPALVGGRARPARLLAGFLPVLALLYLPYIATGGAFGSLWQAGTSWTGASLAFGLLARVLPAGAALAAAALVVVAGAAWIARRFRGRPNTAAAFAWTLTLATVFLPVVHAWYWLGPLALGLAAGVWLPVAAGVLAPLATPLPRDLGQALRGLAAAAASRRRLSGAGGLPHTGRTPSPGERPP